MSFINSSGATSDCAVNCTGVETGTKFADPEDCRNFYICLEDGEPSDMPVACENSLYFDVSSSSCSDTAPASCEPCNYCHSRCEPGITDLIADPMDCQKYYVCLALDNIIPATCENNTYFNGSSCVDDDTVCCNPCAVYCPRGGIEIYDPQDCNMYYLCESEGYPTENYHFLCPDDKPFFDRKTFRCIDSDDVCENPCQV